jgi:hypothetical protein
LAKIGLGAYKAVARFLEAAACGICTITRDPAHTGTPYEVTVIMDRRSRQCAG